ncbi:MAG: maleylpyruvate isomerase family mycothiol-dependent enzyme [Jiangellaceae bacterium]
MQEFPPGRPADPSENGSDDTAIGDVAAPEPAGVGPVTAATDRLVGRVERLDRGDLGEPSLCTGWSRAHVVSHVARNADALTNLLTWASTGVETPMYASAEARDADIAAGAEGDAGTLLDELRASAQRFSTAVASMPDEAWERQVRLGAAAAGATIPARRVLWQRLKEVEIHHVDLDAGYTPADWAPWFVDRALAETLRMFGRRDDVPGLTLVVDGTTERLGPGGDTTVSGPAAAMLGWLTGRSAGDDLSVDPAGSLPPLPAWA